MINLNWFLGVFYDTKSIARLHSISNEECEEKLNRTLPEHEFCIANKKTKSSCYESMGGPIMRYIKDAKYLEGVTSFRKSCNNEMPIVYTRVANYIDWIQEVISNS